MWFTYPFKLGFQFSLSGDTCQQLIGWKKIWNKNTSYYLYNI